MKKRIQNILDINEKASLSKISSELEIPMIELLRNAPRVRMFDVEKIDELFEVLKGWEQVFLLVVTPNFVLEIKDKFPKGFYAHGFLNFHDKTTSIGGHLSVGEINEIFLVKDIMFGRESYSIKFYGKDEKEVFAIYVPRDEKKELIQECLNSFNSL